MLGRASKPRFQQLHLFCLIAVSLGQCVCDRDVDAGTLTFAVEDRRFAAYFRAATFQEAVATCSTTALLGIGVAGALVPVSMLGHVASLLKAEQPQTAQVGACRDAVA